MTHAVENQAPAFAGHDAFSTDRWLAGSLDAATLARIADRAVALGQFVGSEAAQQLAADANRHAPVLRTHDRYGHRIDHVDYHPAYHALMSRALESGVHSLAWKAPVSGFTSRAVLFYLWNQLEAGTACPVTMTFASLAVFSHAPELDREWRAAVLADAHDPRPLPVGEKHGATIGMAMTEKQGGSDLRAVATRATPADGAFRLEGHKWFCSAPMSDGFFTLARDEAGVGCFFVRRSLPDGSRNPFHIQRLKDKCGNRSNASAEIEYHGTFATRVGEPGRGIATLIGMAHHTRFDIVVGVAAMMRAALDQALHHARYRMAFGKTLEKQPLMANVLADLALEAEAALRLAFRLAAAFDRSPHDPAERALQRVLTPIAKYWLCKRMAPMAAEAMECLGGNGYIEEAPLARLYREAPLNGIWEGSANVICLDALRALAREPAGFEALAREIELAREPRLDARVKQARSMLADASIAEAGARRVLERLATSLQASLMLRHSEGVSGRAFVDSRCGADGDLAFGTLDPLTDFAALLERARR